MDSVCADSHGQLAGNIFLIARHCLLRAVDSFASQYDTLVQLNYLLYSEWLARITNCHSSVLALMVSRVTRLVITAHVTVQASTHNDPGSEIHPQVRCGNGSGGQLTGIVQNTHITVPPPPFAMRGCPRRCRYCHPINVNL